MEDFIYILLGIVWVVFSVISANKKKQAASAPGKPKSEDEEIFGEFFPKPMKDVTSNESIPYEEYTEENAEEFDTLPEAELSQETLQPMGAYDAFSGDWNDEASNPVEVISMERNELSMTFFDDDSNAPSTHDSHLLNEFLPLDLRKAIIYQTILQRPEY